jgi:hypothetical protein
MDWFAVGTSCHSIASFAWLMGALAGVLFDLFLVISIALTPPLREHGGDPPPMGAMQKYGLYLAPFAIATLWVGGLWRVGWNQLTCYAELTAGAAAVVIALVLVPLIYTAAHHIARRSVP